MRAGGSFPGRQHLRDGLGVARRIVLLVFLLETARILAAVAGTPLVCRWCVPLGRVRFGRVHSPS